MAQRNYRKPNHSQNLTTQEKSLASSELWKELSTLLRLIEISPLTPDEKRAQNLSKYDLIYRNFILKHAEIKRAKNIEFESFEQFNKTAFFEEAEPDNLIKAVRAAFWANKAAHSVKNVLSCLNKSEKPSKVSNELIQKMQVFYALKAYLIKEVVDKLRTPEMSRLFPSWGFSKDEQGKDTFIIDVPGHGQVSMHIKPNEIGKSALNSHSYEYKFSGLANRTFPSADRFDGAKDDTLASIHHGYVAENNFLGLDKLHNKHIYDYYFSVPNPNHPASNGSNYTIPVTTLFGEKDGRLVPLHKMDDTPKVLYGAINCKEVQAFLFFQIIPDGEIKGEVKKPFHILSYKDSCKSTKALLRTGMPDSTSRKRDNFESDTVVVYCDIDSHGKFVTNTETYKKDIHGEFSCTDSKSVVEPFQCDIVNPLKKTINKEAPAYFHR